MNIHLGAEGVPFLTAHASVPDYKTNNPFEKGPQNARIARVNIFDLSKKEDLVQYQKLWEARGLDVVIVFNENKEYDAKTGSWRVMTHWYMPAYMDNTELREKRLGLVHEIHKTFLEPTKIEEEVKTDAEAERPLT